MLYALDEIENTMLGEDFSWYYHPNTVYFEDTHIVRMDGNSSDTPFFTHIFYFDGRVNSAYFDMVKPIIRELEDRTGRSYMDRLLRIKANLTYRQPDFPVGHYHAPHRDYDIPHEVLLYYVNDADGDTLLFKEDPNMMFGFQGFSISNRVSPEKGKTFLFDGRYYHAGVPPRTSSVRVIINFAFAKSERLE